MHTLARQPSVLFWAFLFPAYVIAFFLFASAASSYLGGWHALTQRFRTEGVFGGSIWNYQSASMRGFLNYGNCLTVGASTAGLYLRPFILLRFCHPALFIPWHEIRVKNERFFMQKVTTLYLSSEHSIPMRIRPRLTQKIRSAAGDQWPERAESRS